MSLFKKLLSLHPGVIREEDVFTEIFVTVIRQNNELLRKFLGVMGIQDFFVSKVETQVAYAKLRGHTQNSRPDIVIKSRTEDGKYDIIFIESKIRSYEHGNQLSRYAEQLAEKHSDARNRYLIYLTRSYDPKDEKKVKKITGAEVHFRSLLWNKFYDLLNEYQNDLLVHEMMLFMEENGMTEFTKLLPTDLSAVAAFVRLYVFMQKSLAGEVEDKYNKVLGIKPKEIYGKDNIESGRVMLWNYINDNRDWAIGIGYDLGYSGQDHPKLQVFLEINPDSPKWNKIASIFKSISEHPVDDKNSWKLVNYENPSDWTHIRMEVFLSSIISHADHLQAVRETLISYLEQVEKIKKQYPSLPWPKK